MLLVVILVYYVGCFIFLNFTYYTLNKYYKKIKYKEKETGKEIDIQEKYAPLVPIDSLNYFSFITIGIIVFPIRIVLVLSTFFFLKINLKILKLIYKNHERDENQRKKIEKAAYFWLSVYFIINNIYIDKKKFNMKKYTKNI